MSDIIQVALDKLVAPPPVYRVEERYDHALKLHLCGSPTLTTGEPKSCCEKFALSEATLEWQQDGTITIDRERTLGRMIQRITMDLRTITGKVSTKDVGLRFWFDRYSCYFYGSRFPKELCLVMAQIHNFAVGLDERLILDRLPQSIELLKRFQEKVMALPLGYTDCSAPYSGRRRRRRRR